MLQFFRHTGRALAAILIAGGIGQTAVAAPVLSTSLNLSFDCVIGCGTTIELVAFGTDGFKIQRIGGGPLAVNQNISLGISVTLLNGVVVGGWSAELINPANGSMGENIFDTSLALLGNLTVTSAAPYAATYFPTQSTGFALRKDINFSAGSVDSVVQSVAVPGPASVLLLGIGLAGLSMVSRRGSRRA